MSSKTVAFVGPPNQRATGINDRRYVNVLFENIPNPATRTQEVYCLKRPGLANDTQPTGASTGRGIYQWRGTTYSVAGNLLTGGSATTFALDTSSGRCWFVETPATASEQLLIMSDGEDNYNITSTNVVAQIDENDSANYPTGNLGPIYYLDGYLIQARANGQIWNSRLNSFTSWAASSFLSASFHGDALEAIHLQKDQMIAFGRNSIETFFNNGNPLGSPLLRIDQNVLDFGIASRNSLAWSGSVAFFVGENAARGDGGRSVWRLQAGSIAEVSNATVNRFLAAEGLSISSCSAWVERVAGQLLYVLNLRAANRSFAYNPENNSWPEWEAAGGGRFNGVAATSINGTVYVQDESNGRIYILRPSTFRDSGSDFTVIIQTERLNYGVDDVKAQSKLTVIADNTLGNLNVSHSDDDFSTFSEPRSIDLSLSPKQLTRLGSFRERAYRFTYADNSSFRAQAFRIEYRHGMTDGI